MKIAFILVVTMVVLSPTQPLPPLKALGFLTQKLLPQLKKQDSKVKEMIISVRKGTDHPLPC